MRPAKDRNPKSKRHPGKFNPHKRTERGHKSRTSPDDIPKDWRIVIGTHAIFEAMSVHPKAIKGAWLKQGWESSQDLKKIYNDLRSKNINPEVKPTAVIDRFGGHQGAAVFMGMTPEIDWTLLERKNESMIMLLDGIEDPHNLGAIIRTSWLMGVDGILIPEDRAVGLTPSGHKVASGGAEHVPVESHVNFSKPVEELKKIGYWVFGLSHLGTKDIFDLKMPEKIVWAIGSEDRGLRSTTENICDELIRIPQVSAAASYNASVAAAIALTETRRQKTKTSSTKS